MAKENSRWTYAHGSRPEGVVLYDDGPGGGSLKLHSHHDTDPARGQSNAFDLVRLHKFGHLDTPADKSQPVTERPSYKAMCALAYEQPELRRATAESDFAVLGDLGPLKEEEKVDHGTQAVARRICDVLNTPTIPEWLIEDTLEQRVIAILAGRRGSYKSFIANDWAFRVALDCDASKGEAVYVVSGEGGDFDRRAAAWFQHYAPSRDPATVPLYVVERRLDLSTHEGVEYVRQDCLKLGIRPKLFVLDTLSKLSGGLEENDNTEVKQFIARLDNGLKRADTGFGATVLIVAHTGHGDATRARGASALGADTDAEYIVFRNPGHESVSVTRERFKSSPELEPLCYEPESVQLRGRQDRSGRPVTSLVMKPADPPETTASGRAPLTDDQRKVLSTARRMQRDSPSIAIEDLVTGMLRELPKPTGGGKDQRRRQVERRIEQLVNKGRLFMQGEDRVSVMAVTPASGEDFLV